MIQKGAARVSGACERRADKRRLFLLGFATIGKCPVSHATDPMSFSPIDMTAKAVVLLSGTNDMFTAFKADSRYVIDEWKLIEAANRCGICIVWASHGPCRIWHIWSVYLPNLPHWIILRWMKNKRTAEHPCRA